MESRAPKTVYQLEQIVKRALEECVQAGTIRKEVVEDNHFNIDAAASHISQTIIGELHELEIIRRLAPIFREIPRLVKDFQLIDAEQATESHRAALKIQEG